MSNASDAPLRIIRPSGPKTEKTTQAEPTLLVSLTSNYNWLYNDHGTGSSMDVSVYRPAPSDSTFFIVGDYAQGNYNNPYGPSLIVKALNDNPSNPLLKAPTGYSQVWNDHGSGGTYDGSFWYPVAPDGYVSIGCVCNGGYNPPVIPQYMCVRKDLTTSAQGGPLIWNDRGSGANMDVSLYQIVDVPGTFVAQGNYNPLNTPVWKLKVS
ncbi:MAG TPA: Vps62-related protein [Pyrinomonadaceae bacterium]